MESVKAIVYKSNAGHTKAYAELLSEETGIPAYSLDEAVGSLPAKTGIIYMGWLMAGQIKGYLKAEKTFDIKALVGVGMAANGTQVDDIEKANYIRSEVKVMSLQGGFEMEKLHGVYKMMMKMMQKTVAKNMAKKENRTAEDDDMLDMMLHGSNRVRKENLIEVLSWLRNQE